MFQSVKSTISSLLTWDWTKKLLYWVVISAGTISEGIFLASSLWVTLNASVHPLMLVFIPEAWTLHITEFATASFVGLPECILALAICTTWNHIRIFRYDRSSYGSLFWAIAYGIPTVIFLILSIMTIGCSMLHVGFVLPDWAIVTRGLSGYAYGIIALLYWRLGYQQEADRLKEKDDIYALLKQQSESDLALLRQEKDALNAEIARIQQQLYAAYKEKEAAIEEKMMLHSVYVQSPEQALQAYGDNVIEWLNGLDKTVELDDIAAHVSINKKRLQGAIEKGELRIRGTNRSRIWVPSLREYLIKNAPKPLSKEAGPLLRIVSGGEI